MALYEITQDCRIANVEYQKWDVVSDTEVGGFYPTVMKPTKAMPKKAVKEEVKSELTEEENVEVEEVKEVEVKKPAKKWKRK